MESRGIRFPLLILIPIFMFFNDTLVCKKVSKYFKSIDGGFSWDTISVSTSFQIENLLKQGNRFWMRTWYSDDFCNSWNNLNPSTLQGNCGFTYPGDYVGVLINNLYSVDFYGSVTRLNPITNDWTELFCFPVDIWSNAEDPMLYTINNSLIITYDSMLYSSYDEGATWNTISMNGLPRHQYLGNKITPTKIVGTNGELYCKVDNNGIYYSHNGGLDWSPLTPTIPFKPSSLTIFNNELYVGSYFRGVWKYDLPVGIKNNSIINNNQIKINSNFSNGILFIEIQNWKNNNWHLRIFDQLGKVSFNKSEINQTEYISASHLSNGIYYCQVYNDENIIGSFKVVIVQ